MRWTETSIKTLRDPGKALAERAGYLPADSFLASRCGARYAAEATGGDVRRLFEAAGLEWREQPMPGGARLFVEGTAAGAADERLPELFETPDVHTIAQLAAFAGLPKEALVKSVVVTITTMAAGGGGGPVLCLLRGDHQLDDTKLQRMLDPASGAVRDASPDEIRAAFGADPGSLGPVGVPGVRIIADYALAGMSGLVTGGNRTGWHLRHVTPGRDFLCEFAAIRKGSSGTVTRPLAQAGALCLDHFLSAAIERNQDADGVTLPVALAPFTAVITPVNLGTTVQREVTERIYSELLGHGVDVLLDDRDERPGVKFKDADLIGFPFRITVGKRAAEGLVELVVRRPRSTSEVAVAEAAEAVHRGASKLPPAHG